jgi:hypothetical protein
VGHDSGSRNIGDAPVWVTRNPGIIPGVPPLPPGMTEIVEHLNVSSDAVRGAFAIVEQGRANDVSFTLRTRDVSRQHQTWGTTIPVVRQHELFARTFTLLDIPAEAQFRSTLRIYDVDAATPPSVRVRVYGFYLSGTATVEDTLLAAMTPAFAMPPSSAFPASAEIPLDFPTPVGQRLRVEIEPLDGRQEYWGLVSVTHNETQHVTVITPE